VEESKARKQAAADAADREEEVQRAIERHKQAELDAKMALAAQEVAPPTIPTKEVLASPPPPE